MIADIQKMFSFWRARRDLEIGIAGPMEIEDVEQRGDVLSLKQNGFQLAMKQQPTQQNQFRQQQLQVKAVRIFPDKQVNTNLSYFAICMVCIYVWFCGEM